MNFQIENQGTSTFLVYKLSEEDRIDNLSYGMISNNNITGIVQFSLSQKNEDRYFKYNISAKINMKQFFAGAVNKKRFLGVFSSIATAILSSEEYMLDTSKFVIDTEYIFCNVSSAKAELICLPIIGDSPSFDMSKFFKEIVFSTQFDQTENCDYVAKIISFLNSKSNFSLSEFKLMLDGLLYNNVPQQPQPFAPAVVPQPIVQPPKPQVQPFIAPQLNIPVASAPVVKAPTPPLMNDASNTKQCIKCKSELKAAAKFCTKCGTLQPTSNNTPVNANAPSYLQEKTEKKGLFGGKNGKVEAPKAAPPVNASFSVPWQNVPPVKPASNGFAIPGQQTPIKTPVQVAQPVSKSTPQPPIQQIPPVFIPPTNMPPQGNFGETTVLGGSAAGETTVLGIAEQQAQAPKPYIVRIKSGQKMFIEKNIFRMGKEKSFVDFFIGDNTAISRSHADILTKEGEYLIIDNNSTNHTYLDGIMIQSQCVTKLSHGMKIKLANEEFEFKLF